MNVVLFIDLVEQSRRYQALEPMSERDVLHWKQITSVNENVLWQKLCGQVVFLQVTFVNFPFLHVYYRQSPHQSRDGDPQSSRYHGSRTLRKRIGSGAKVVHTKNNLVY